MDENGCRYTIMSGSLTGNRTHNIIVIEKTVIMKQPINGELIKDSESSFFYRPRSGFRGRDNFVIYICGNQSGKSGCARWNYNVTVR
jgi:hypothetical protein